MYIPPLFICSLVNECLGCVHLLAVVNNSAVNIGVQIPVQVPVFNSFGYITRSGIVGLYGHSI